MIGQWVLGILAGMGGYFLLAAIVMVIQDNRKACAQAKYAKQAKQAADKKARQIAWHKEREEILEQAAYMLSMKNQCFHRIAYDLREAVTYALEHAALKGRLDALEEHKP